MQSKKNNVKLSEFYKERFDSFLIHLSAAKQLKEEDIHKLRVDIKHIRSLLLLADELDVADSVKFRKQFKKLFKVLGKLRALQVSKSLLRISQVEIPQEIFKSLDDKISIVSKQVKPEIMNFDLVKYRKRLLNLLYSLDQINVKKVEEETKQVIVSELDIIRKLFNSSSGENNHHEIRKILKQIKSLLQMLLAISQDQSRELILDLVNQTETVLGNWHDHKVLEKFISKLEKEFVKTDLKRTLRNIKNRNNRQKLEVKRESDRLLRTNFNPLSF